MDTTDIVLKNHAAKEFFEKMLSVDIEAIKARDKFISDVNCWINNEGILVIDIPDLKILKGE